MEFNHGVLFSDTYQKKLKSQFYYADKDPQYGARLFFENSGGSLRLKRAVEAKAAIEEFPDCPERARGRGFDLADYVKNGTKEILEVIFGAKSGALITELTASQTMFHAVGTIMEGVDWGKNAVTSALEHPSAHDAVEYYCKKTGREFREVPANKVTGGLDPDEIMKYVDKDTVLLSIMAASNISGNIMDIKEIARRAKEINPDIYVVSDAVQHAPHAVIDVEDWDVDVCNFAPYKFFGVRGCGYAYVSDRVAVMPHIKLTCKDDNVWALGTPAPANFAAMMAVIDYVCSIGKHFLGDFAQKYNKRELFVEGKSRSLGALCEHYGIINSSAHRAYHDALATAKLYQTLAHYFETSEPKLFVPEKMGFKAKKQQPMTKKQKAYLKDLCKYHKIEFNDAMEQMTMSEASRWIDKTILQYGRMKRFNRSDRNE